MILPLESNRVRRTYLGGGRIDAFTGSRPAADGVPRPEDWLASTTTAYNGTHEIEGEGLGRIADGRLVRDVAGTLPILVKLLDSDERLVVQAHPTVPFARAHMNSPVGKTECWCFLPGTAADACVYLGFRPGVTREMWRHAFEAQDGLLELLHRVPVRAGDFVFVDGGVPHAIGAGCFMVELQEPSDLMVVAERFTPSGRRIPDGKIYGGLDLDGMLDVYCYDGVTYGELCGRYVRRSAVYPASEPAVRMLDPGMTDKFEMWRMVDGGTVSLSGRSAVAVVVEGDGMLNGCSVRKGDRLLVYAERELAVKGKAVVLVCK
ncbi:MAG: class I mannose-6-phosphate isomerase [Kiritimatiellae bacterium]|nr:class I mannose-6-phosphate isomerase [Kiritimatiellia bacterium]